MREALERVMVPITALVKRHPALTYFILTFAISWGGVILVLGGVADSGVRAQDSPAFPLAVLAMVAGPSVSGLLLTWLVGGWRGLRDFGARLFRWRVGLRWYVIGLLAAPLVSVAVTWVLSGISPEFRPGVAVGDAQYSVLLLGLVVAGVAGVFEEVGWTGFAIPHLRRRHGVIATGLIVGLLWSAWHILVVVWGIGDRAGSIPLAVFVIVDGLAGLPAFRVLMVWVYDRTQSLLLGILMHASLTATVIVLTPQTTGGFLLLYGLGFAAGVWVIILMAILASGRRYHLRGRTTPFRGADGESLAGSIAEVDYLQLGGVEQWVMIRGENIANPPLIHLHGGPGFSEMRLFRHYNAPLEKVFTVVSWDQRGTAKSFDRRIPRSSMTVEQFMADLDELVECVRQRLGQDKVVIFGHSWGSALGALYAARFPEKVAAYVGAAQVGDWVAAESASYAFALAEAVRRNHRRAIRQLRAIGPPPYSASSLMTERTWLQHFDGQLKPRALWNLSRVLFRGPESSLADAPSVVRGVRFSLDTMWDEVSRLNLLVRVPELQMPVFFLLGQRDHWIPAETSVAYFDVLTAPSKRLIWFERSGHELFVDEPEKFNATMVELVRPAVDAISRPAPRRSAA